MIGRWFGGDQATKSGDISKKSKNIFENSSTQTQSTDCKHTPLDRYLSVKISVQRPAIIACWNKFELRFDFSLHWALQYKVCIVVVAATVWLYRSQACVWFFCFSLAKLTFFFVFLWFLCLIIQYRKNLFKFFSLARTYADHSGICISTAIVHSFVSFLATRSIGASLNLRL